MAAPVKLIKSALNKFVAVKIGRSDCSAPPLVNQIARARPAL
jgi:hypothetical protein